MRIAVITESHFGNTAALASAIAEGARSAGAEVVERPAGDATLPPGTDLVVLAGPTHNLGMSTPASRAKATAQRADASGGPTGAGGVREWIETVAVPAGVPVATVSTVVPSGMSGSAARKAATALRRRGARVLGHWDFVVAGGHGPLAEGELQRARALGAEVGRGQTPARQPAPSARIGSASGTTRRPGRRGWLWVVGLVLVAAAVVTLWSLLQPDPHAGDRTKLDAPLTATQQSAASARVVTATELAAADGRDGHPAWVAVDGVVYDVSAFRQWADGRHHGVRAGTDATERFVGSGHAADRLALLPVVGRLG